MVDFCGIVLYERWDKAEHNIFITTILNMKSPGIRLYKLALFGWAVVTAILLLLLLLSLPVLAGGITMIIIDKNHILN